MCCTSSAARTCSRRRAMSTEKTMANACELAQRNTIRAFRSGPKVVIVAEGDLPSPGYDAKITQRPEKIFPPWYQVLRCARPGFFPPVVVPYRVSLTINHPEDRDVARSRTRSPNCPRSSRSTPTRSRRYASSRSAGCSAGSPASTTSTCASAARTTDPYFHPWRSINSLNAGSSRIGSKSGSSFAYERQCSERSIASPRWSTASPVRPARLSQQARL